jgi:hypothetical protein
VARATNNGGKHSAGSVITSKSSLAHTTAVIHNESLNVTVRHLGLIEKEREEKEKS